jgi:hypothetical protein
MWFLMDCFDMVVSWGEVKTELNYLSYTSESVIQSACWLERLPPDIAARGRGFFLCFETNLNCQQFLDVGGVGMHP